MPGIVRFGDLCSGHEDWPPRRGISCSADVVVDGIPVERETDSLEIHCDDDGDCHPGMYIGNRSCKANNLSIQVIGDPIDCGSFCAEGSSSTDLI